jgi:hypothetical protein
MHSLRRGFVWVGLAVSLAGISLPRIGLSQDPQPQKPATVNVTLPQGPLLPEKFGTWTRSGEPNETTDIANSSLAGAKAFVEDGATRYAAASYKSASGGGTVQVDAVQFVDVSGAYSAFTWWASKQGRSTLARPEGEQAMIAGQGLLFRSGAVVVLVHDSPAQRQVMQQLGLVLPKIFGPKGQLPLIPTLLPVRGLATGSIRYALGPQSYTAMGGLLPPEIVGFDKAAETATAEYSVHGAKAMLTVLLYPTPQLSAQHGRAIEAAANADRAKFGKTLKLRRDGTLLAMAWGDLPAAAADALVKSANLHEAVSWNNALMAVPDFQTEIHKTATLLQNIVVLSGVLGAAAILLGFFLGFGRAWIRVLMGKPAAVEPEFLGINLRGIPPGALEAHAGGPETPLE